MGAGLPKVAVGAPKDIDRLSGLILVVLIIAVLVVCAAAVVVSDGIDWYDVAPLLALPFAVVGAIGYAVKRRWIVLIIAVVVTAALVFLWAPAGYAVMFILLCSSGIAYSASLAQRRWFGLVVRSVERSGIGGGFRGKAIRRLFAIPSNTDTRVVRFSPTVRRKGIPLDELLATLRLALIPSLLAWTLLFTSIYFHVRWAPAYSSLMMVSVYIVAISLPWLILRTMDVRAGREGGGARLHEGLLGNAAGMSVVLFIALILVAFQLYWGSETVLYIIVSALMTALVAVASSVIYYLDYEHGTVTEVASSVRCAWPDPEGERGPGLLEDGIPLTPVRDQKY